MGPTIYRAGRWGATEARYGPVASPRRLCYASAIRQWPDMTKPASLSFADRGDTGFRSRHGDKSIIANRSVPVKGIAAVMAAIYLLHCYIGHVTSAAPTEEQP